MASWTELKTYIENNYKISEDSGDILRMLFNLEGGRSQFVVVSRFTNDNTGEEWVGISSPIAEVGAVDITQAARMAFDVLCGGIVVVADMVYLHHAAPLVNLDTNEFERPLSILVGQGDQIEKALVGSDNY